MAKIRIETAPFDSNRCDDSADAESSAVTLRSTGNVFRPAGAELSFRADRRLRLSMKQAIDESFVFAFRRVMLTALCLALASALVAYMVIENRRPDNLTFKPFTRSASFESFYGEPARKRIGEYSQSRLGLTAHFAAEPQGDYNLPTIQQMPKFRQLRSR